MKMLTDKECGFIKVKNLEGQGEIALMRFA